MTSTYLFGGLRIEARPALARLWKDESASRPPRDIELIHAGPPSPADGEQLFAWPGRFGMSLWAREDGWAFRSSALDVEVRVSADGRRLRCYADDPGSDGLMEFLVRRVFPRLALLHGGRLTLHAAAVQGAGGCLLLSGQTGAGKSTLSTALAMTGAWRLLSDDVSILAPEALRVWPSAPGAYLTPTSVEGLGLDPASGAPDPSRSGKAWFDRGDAIREAMPVAGLVFLNRTAPRIGPRLAPIPRPVALRLAWRQVIRFNPVDGCEAARLFEALTAIVWRAPAFQLDYPADYAAIPKVDAELRRTWNPELAA